LAGAIARARISIGRKRADQAGQTDSALRYLALAEAKDKQASEEKASADFTQALSGFYAPGQAQPQAQPQQPRPAVVAPQPAPAPQVGPQAPQGGVGIPLRVPSTSRVWGDDEAEAAGLYEPRPKPAPLSLASLGAPQWNRPSAAPTGDGLSLAALGGQAPEIWPQVAQPQQRQAQAPAAAIPSSRASDEAPLAPQSNTPPVPVLIAASSSPRLPQAQRDVAKALLGKALDAGELTGTQKDYALYLRQGGKLDFFNYQKELKIAERFRLTLAHAATVVRLAGIGRRGA
jgi:hypothetical protein